MMGVVRKLRRVAVSWVDLLRWMDVEGVVNPCVGGVHGMKMKGRSESAQDAIFCFPRAAGGLEFVRSNKGLRWSDEMMIK